VPMPPGYSSPPMTASPAPSGTVRPSRRPGGRSSDLASRKPLVMGVMALCLSVVLAIWTATTAEAQPILGGLELPLAETSTWVLSVGGYFLTPVATIAAVIWDQIAQRRGLRNRNFGLRPIYSTALRHIAIAGFGIAIWHVLNIANALAGGA
jgi:hypothetical protein